MLSAAAHLARLGSAVVSALAAVLMAVLLAFGGFALWQDAAVSRGAFASADLLQYKPADKNTAAPTLAELQALNPDVCGWLTIDGTHIDYPLVQGATNMDYINRDVYGEFSLSGGGVSGQPQQGGFQRWVFHCLRPPYGEWRNVRRYIKVCAGRLLCGAPFRQSDTARCSV